MWVETLGTVEVEMVSRGFECKEIERSGVSFRFDLGSSHHRYPTGDLAEYGDMEQHRDMEGCGWRSLLHVIDYHLLSCGIIYHSPP